MPKRRPPVPGPLVCAKVCAWSWSGRACPRCASTSRCKGIVRSAALHLIHHRDVAVQADDAGSPFGGAAVPDAGSVMRGSVSDIALRRGAEVELAMVRCWFAMVQRSQLDRSRQHPHAAEGSQSTNRNEPAPVPVRAGGAARNGLWRPEHSRWRSVPRSLTVMRTAPHVAPLRSTRSFARSRPRVDRSV